LHARDARGATSPKEDPIMSHLEELSGATTMPNDALAASVPRHRNSFAPANSPTLQEVRL
jgi:hypothetical protein